MIDALALLSDTELRRMTDRAYIDAARSWSEYRSAVREAGHTTTALCRMLSDAAISDSAYWRTLHDACMARDC
jgi:hypothetical protein